MPDFTLTDLARIIERDSKDSTYKFALLRGTIDIIQNFPHFKQIDSSMKVSYPMGLMVIKWIDYYYPLLAARIPQKYGENESRTIAFRKEFEELIDMYPPGASAEQLMYDLKKGIRDQNRIKPVLRLCRKLRDTIVKQPMHYIGSAIGRGGEIYSYKGNRSGKITTLDQEWLINHMGSFSIPIEFHHVLLAVGAFISGTNSIIFKWAEFTSGLKTDSSLQTSDIISMLSKDVSERDVKQAKDFYSDILVRDKLECVWTGKKLQVNSMNIDHAFPFVALRNNDLWNLLPAHQQVNNEKRDAVPTTDILKQKQVKERIIKVWSNLALKFEDQFFNEIRIALLGNNRLDLNNWENSCYTGLINMSEYLINQRGLIPWQIRK